MFKLKVFFSLLLFVIGVFLPVQAVTIAKKPLFLESVVPPNIMFTLDDSGSMARTFLPETIGDGGNNCVSPSSSNIVPYYLSSGLYRTLNGITQSVPAYGVGLCKAQNFNQLFYDPRITYTPRIKYDKTKMALGDTTTCKSVIYEEQTCTATGTFSGSVADTQIGIDSAAATTAATLCTDTNSSGSDTKTCTRTCDNPESSQTWTGKNSCKNISYSCYSLPDISACPECQSVALATANLSSMYLKRPSTALILSDPICHKSRYRYCKKSSGSVYQTTAVSCSSTAVPTYSCTKNRYYANTPGKSISPYPSTTITTSNDNYKKIYSEPTCEYFRYTPATTGKKADTTTANYTFVAVDPSDISKTYDSRSYDNNSSSYTTNRTDCVNPNACTYAEEIQNYANWSTYYKSRIMAATTYIGLAFSKLSDSMRVGFAKINQTATSIVGSNTDTIVLPVRTFNSANRNTFYTKLYGATANNSTPLRQAMDSVGQYFSRDNNAGSPWADNPDNVSNPGGFSQCRQSYNILMTDGYWNDGEAATSGARANVDGSTGPAITRPGTTNYVYTAVAPYSDTADNTLADVAMYYWNRDLAPNILNKVPKTSADPVAVWQHLTQFTVGFGVSGQLNVTYPTKTNVQILAGLTDGSINWPTPDATATNDDPKKIDDLWHAAINARGGFYNASNPTEFINALTSALKEIESYSGSFSVVSTNSSSLTTNTALYQAGFLSGWVGRLYKYSLNVVTGVVASTPTKATLPVYSDRKIYMWKDSATKATFDWVNLSSTQQGFLSIDPDTSISAATDGQNRLLYLKGDQSKEAQNSGLFRNRKLPADTTGGSPVLGDIINSAALYVSDEDYGYGDKVSALLEKDTYKAFNKSARTPIIYVGANDGMLHAFSADTLAEKYAVIPSAIFYKLNLLTSPNYAHDYYVDGSPVAGDAYVNGGWKTILLGSTGAGGKSVFALDITDPEHFTANKLMWEFDNSNATYSADMGYSIPHPAIARLKNGKWVAIISNGYTSANGHAVLFVVDLSDGSVLRTIDTGVGSDNGLSSPAPVDKDGDRITDYVYAGDLKGNLWKFDLTSTTAASWSATKLFTACTADTCSDSNRQPITARPEAMMHPEGGCWCCLDLEAILRNQIILQLESKHCMVSGTMIHRHR